MMAGLNHESTAAVGDDLAIDLEVTSNRPDCLGHIGIAREVAVLVGPAAGDSRRRGPPRAPTPVDRAGPRADRLPGALLRATRPGWSAA